MPGKDWLCRCTMEVRIVNAAANFFISTRIGTFFEDWMRDMMICPKFAAAFLERDGS